MPVPITKHGTAAWADMSAAGQRGLL
ncbi:MAG: DUF3787 domain-containing protein [Clostridia bacterium]|nr:DUF3787 domain-containing protein [Clostridia bacterium]